MAAEKWQETDGTASASWHDFTWEDVVEAVREISATSDNPELPFDVI